MAKRGDIDLRMSTTELRSVLISSLFIGFAVSFNNWGIGDRFIFSVGLINLFLATLICAITIWLRTNIQKRAGVSEMTTVTFKHNYTNSVYTFLISILSAGAFVFAASGRPEVRSVTLLRPGYRESHLSPFRVSRIVAVGTVVSLILIAFAKLWLVYGGGILATYLLKTNVWMALVSLIPLPVKGLAAIYQRTPFYQLAPGIARAIQIGTPSFEGEQVFFGARPLWFSLAIATILVSGFITLGVGSLNSLILSAIIAFAAGLIWIYYIEFKK